MNQIPWLGYLIALLGGGAAGAAIKLLYDLALHRIQPVSTRVNLFPLFRSDRKYTDLKASISVAHEGVIVEYSDLFVADITLQNIGKHDHGDFEFGVVIQDGRCVHASWEDPDQHHALTTLDKVTPKEPRQKLKFRARPFNRRNQYSLRLYLIPENEESAPAVLTFTSPHAVHFVDELEKKERDLKKLQVAATVLAIVLAALLLSIRPSLIGYSMGSTLEKVIRFLSEESPVPRTNPSAESAPNQTPAPDGGRRR